MLTSKFFSDPGHADFYLKGCVVKHKGEAIYIRRVVGGKADAQWCKDLDPYGGEDKLKDIRRFSLELDDLDLSPVSLGMANLQDPNKEPRAVYVARVPIRVFRVGLTTETMAIRPIVEGGWICPPGYIIPTKILDAMDKNEYPGYEEAFEAVNIPRKRSLYQAFSRRWCLGSGGKIYYKMLGVPVGMAKPDGVQLFDDHAYLREVLEEDMR